MPVLMEQTESYSRAESPGRAMPVLAKQTESNSRAKSPQGNMPILAEQTVSYPRTESPFGAMPILTEHAETVSSARSTCETMPVLTDESMKWDKQTSCMGTSDCSKDTNSYSLNVTNLGEQSESDKIPMIECMPLLVKNAEPVSVVEDGHPCVVATAAIDDTVTKSEMLSTCDLMAKGHAETCIPGKAASGILQEIPGKAASGILQETITESGSESCVKEDPFVDSENKISSEELLVSNKITSSKGQKAPLSDDKPVTRNFDMPKTESISLQNQLTAVDRSTYFPSEQALHCDRRGQLNQNTIFMDTESIGSYPELDQSAVLHFVHPSVQADKDNGQALCPAAYLYYQQADQSYQILPINEIVIQNDEDMVLTGDGTDEKKTSHNVNHKKKSDYASKKKRNKCANENLPLVAEKKKVAQSTQRKKNSKAVVAQNTKIKSHSKEILKNKKMERKKDKSEKTSTTKSKQVKKSGAKKVIDVTVATKQRDSKVCNITKPKVNGGIKNKSINHLGNAEYGGDISPLEGIFLETEGGKRRKKKAKRCDCCLFDNIGDVVTNDEESQSGSGMQHSNQETPYPVTQDQKPKFSKSRSILKKDARDIKKFSRPGQKYKCPHCPFTTHNKYYLKRIHIPKHTKDLTFSCNLCNFKSMSSNMIKKHKKKHAEGKTAGFGPGLPRNRYLNSDAGLNELSTKHRRKKGSKCNNKTFAFEKNMQRHQRDTTDDDLNLMYCQICGVAFTKLSRLERHFRKKHSVTDLQCEKCTSLVFTKGKLLKHKKSPYETWMTTKRKVCFRCMKSSKSRTYTEQRKSSKSKAYSGPRKCCSVKNIHSYPRIRNPSLILDKLKYTNFVKNEDNTYTFHSESGTVVIDSFHMQQLEGVTETNGSLLNADIEGEKEEDQMAEVAFTDEKLSKKVPLLFPMIKLLKLNAEQIRERNAFNVSNLCCQLNSSSNGKRGKRQGDSRTERKKEFLSRKYSKHTDAHTINGSLEENISVYSRRKRKPKQLESYYVTDFVLPWSDTDSDNEDREDLNDQNTKKIRKSKQNQTKPQIISYFDKGEDPDWSPKAVRKTKTTDCTQGKCKVDSDLEGEGDSDWSPAREKIPDSPEFESEKVHKKNSAKSVGVKPKETEIGANKEKESHGTKGARSQSKKIMILKYQPAKGKHQNNLDGDDIKSKINCHRASSVTVNGRVTDNTGPISKLGKDSKCSTLDQAVVQHSPTWYGYKNAVCPSSEMKVAQNAHGDGVDVGRNKSVISPGQPPRAVDQYSSRLPIAASRKHNILPGQMGKISEDDLSKNSVTKMSQSKSGVSCESLGSNHIWKEQNNNTVNYDKRSDSSKDLDGRNGVKTTVERDNIFATLNLLQVECKEKLASCQYN